MFKVVVAEMPVGSPDREAVGAVLSITMALLAPRLLAAPGVARVRVAGLAAASLMVPELRSRACAHVV